MRETEKIFINNKFCGYGFKRNHQERVVNRTSTNDTTNITEIIQKLGQLEDIEDELGIDLVLIGKLLTQGFYFKDEKCNILHLSKEELKEGLFETIEDTHKYLKEYGKTWALTKEELEK